MSEQPHSIGELASAAWFRFKAKPKKAKPKKAKKSKSTESTFTERRQKLKMEGKILALRENELDLEEVLEENLNVGVHRFTLRMETPPTLTHHGHGDKSSYGYYAAGYTIEYIFTLIREDKSTAQLKLECRINPDAMRKTCECMFRDTSNDQWLEARTYQKVAAHNFEKLLNKGILGVEKKLDFNDDYTINDLKGKLAKIRSEIEDTQQSL